jgi:hypothetical protein
VSEISSPAGEYVNESTIGAVSSNVVNVCVCTVLCNIGVAPALSATDDT